MYDVPDRPEPQDVADVIACSRCGEDTEDTGHSTPLCELCRPKSTYTSTDEDGNEFVYIEVTPMVQTTEKMLDALGVLADSPMAKRQAE